MSRFNTIYSAPVLEFFKIFYLVTHPTGTKLIVLTSLKRLFLVSFLFIHKDIIIVHELFVIKRYIGTNLYNLCHFKMKSQYITNGVINIIDEQIQQMQ